MIMQTESDQASRNPNGSTGPRSPQGKERAKMNAMTHSLTARIVLPWENEADYDARLVRYKTGLPVRSELEEELAERGSGLVADGPRHGGRNCAVDPAG